MSEGVVSVRFLGGKMGENEYHKVTEQIRQRVDTVGNHGGTLPENASAKFTCGEQDIHERAPEGDVSYFLFSVLHIVQIEAQR